MTTFRWTPQGGAVHLYDSEGDDSVSGPTGLNTSDFEQWRWSEEDREQPRDWGRRTMPIFWTRYSSDLGFFVGGGARFDSYAFRKSPFASSVAVRARFSPSESKGRFELDARFRLEDSPLFAGLSVRASGLDVINYYGLGNDSPSGDPTFHKVDHRSTSAEATLGVNGEGGVTLIAGLVLSRTSSAQNEGRFFGELRDSIYGAVDFFRLGATARVVYDPQADSDAAPNRVRLTLQGTTFPRYLVDVERSFAKAETEISAVLSPSVSSPISLALRDGATRVWGRFPFSDAAFLGGSTTLRGWNEQRFAGDAAVFTSAELRLRLGYPVVIVPVGAGIFGFVDSGRVYVDGASPGG